MSGPAATVHVGASGDILAHFPVLKAAAANADGQGYDFDPMFAQVKPQLSALDLAICQMETPLSRDNTDLSVPGAMSFNVPHEIAGTLKRAGFDGCSRVSNHVVDRGLPGIASTQQVLQDAGLKEAGPSATSSTAQRAAFYDVKGLKVANLAYTYTSMNAGDPNTNLPADIPWMKYWQFPNVGVSGILADAAAAKKAGADIVILSMHWGKEYSTEANELQRAMAKQLLASSDVDAIFGAHAHVTQSCEKINGKYAVYGMGNFISNQGRPGSGLKPETQVGMIVDLALTRGQDGKITQQLSYQPTRVNLSNYVIEPTSPTFHPEAYAMVKKSMDGLGAGACDAKAKTP